MLSKTFENYCGKVNDGILLFFLAEESLKHFEIACNIFPGFKEYIILGNICSIP